MGRRQECKHCGFQQGDHCCGARTRDVIAELRTAVESYEKLLQEKEAIVPAAAPSLEALKWKDGAPIILVSDDRVTVSLWNDAETGAVIVAKRNLPDGQIVRTWKMKELIDDGR